MILFCAGVFAGLLLAAIILYLVITRPETEWHPKGQPMPKTHIRYPSGPSNT